MNTGERKNTPHLRALGDSSQSLLRGLSDCSSGEMDADSCAPFPPQNSRTTQTNSPGVDPAAGGGSGSFLPCDELQKPLHSHLPPPLLPHRFSLRGDLYAAAMSRFGESAVNFTHGSATANPSCSPPKHSKFLDGLNQDQKAATISRKAAFYENSADGEYRTDILSIKEKRSASTLFHLGI